MLANASAHHSSSPSSSPAQVKAAPLTGLTATDFDPQGSPPEENADRYLEKQALDAAPVPAETVALLQNYLAISDAAESAFDRIATLCTDAGFDFSEPLFQVRNHAAQLQALSPDADVVFDTSFSPRLDYYTGIVFEMTGSDGAILASGGEYDRMLERLGSPEPVNASGCSLWVDRMQQETGDE